MVKGTKLSKRQPHAEQGRLSQTTASLPSCHINKGNHKEKLLWLLVLIGIALQFDSPSRNARDLSLRFSSTTTTTSLLPVSNNSLEALKNNENKSHVNKTDNTNNSTTDKRGHAIVILLPNHDEDFVRVRGAIRSIDQYLADERKTPLLMFQEGDISTDVQNWIRNLTTRSVQFPLVDFTEFPASFKRRTARGRRMKGRKNPWGYWQMCRFWVTKIWEHPILDNYSTIMRMDTDSCLTSNTSQTPLPTLPRDTVYAPNTVNHPAYTTKFLWETALQYVQDTNRTPANLDMWNGIPEYQKKRKAMPSFYNNFEVTSVDFFRQPHVMAFQRHLSENPPHGIFRHKWGDAPIRMLTVALFAQPDQIAWGLNEHYGHGAQCPFYLDPPGALVIPTTSSTPPITIIAPPPPPDKRIATTTGTVVSSPQQITSLRHDNTFTMRWLEEQSTRQRSYCPTDSDVIDVHSVTPMKNDKRFNCDYERPLPTVYYCGNIQRPSHHPFRWECRLKKRVLERIDQFALKQAPFSILDLGSAYVDWVLAVGSYAPHSQLVPVEANVAPFRNMYQHLMVNPGLSRRVHGLNAAVMSKEVFLSGSSTTLDGSLVSQDNQTWIGPVLCDDGTDKEGVMETTATNVVAGSSCLPKEVQVPIIILDMIAAKGQQFIKEGTLFFIKMDLEGAEYDALQGGREMFSNPNTRPCIVMIELKNVATKPYKQAFDFLVEMGYTDYEDIDSGVQGIDAWPPKGQLFSNEGNYEFRLPANDLEQCAARVLNKSQQQTS